MTEPTGAGRTADRLFRGYGPLIGFAAILAAVALLVPTARQEVVTRAASDRVTADGPTAGAAGPGTPGAAAGADPAGAAAGSGPATTAGTGAAGGATATRVAGATQSRAAAAAGPRAAASAAAAGTGGVAPCAGRTLQDPNDPYSPPCYTFSGDNGGATSPGVTRDTITVSVRLQAFDNGLVDALSTLAGAKIPHESDALLTQTLNGLVDYLNRSYQFYGRKLKLVVYSGKGSVTDEILGGGQEGAESDALNVQTQIGAFADASGVTPPYVTALAKRKIISTGAPYMSSQWLSNLAPYAWSPLTDCSTIVKTVSSYYLAKMAGKPASLAGGPLANQPRKVAVIAPENSWYQECANDGINLIKAAGHGSEIALDSSYKIDVSQITPQAQTLIQQLKSNNITTVICGCDPLLLASLTGKAREQQYRPEWVETAVAFTDQDLVGELMDPQVWNHAVGISFNGPTQPIGAGVGARAFKAVQPGATPSQAADLMYSQLQLLAIGIQMAGPDLTPDTFAQGMFRYPQRTGPLGTWKFGPGDYTTSQDAREVWWNSSGISPQTGDPGTWVDPAPGKRYPIGQFPPGDPQVG